jgi:hypothetical protein
MPRCRVIGALRTPNAEGREKGPIPVAQRNECANYPYFSIQTYT